jgi:hypothetical protein
MGRALAFRETAETPYATRGDGPTACIDGGEADNREYSDVAATLDRGPSGSSPESGIQPDVGAIEEIGDEIATLAAHIHAATHRLLVLIGEFDRLRGWELAGYQTCAHWLAFRTGLDLGAAREKVRAARALERLPITGAAMARGELSFSQVRALSRVANPENEAELVDLARGTTTAQLERMVRAWKKGSRKDEAEWERERHRSRSLSVFPDDDGMYVVKGRLMPEVGALLMRAIEAASDALFHERQTAPVALLTDEERELEAGRRRADAIGLLAERGLSADLGGHHAHSGRSEGAADPRVSAETSQPSVPISGTRAERYQVVLHVEPATLSSDEEPGRSDFEDGTRVSAETSRRLSCDASVVRVEHASDGSILDVGRKTRSIPPAIRRALEVRDRGCRFPGCGLRFTDAHHVKHWAEGGETSLENCVLLCRHHHRLVHEGGWWIEWWGKGRPAFFSPRGEMRFDGGWQAPSHLPDDPVAALVLAHAELGLQPDGWTAGAQWKREADIPDEVIQRAWEAI